MTQDVVYSHSIRAINDIFGQMYPIGFKRCLIVSARTELPPSNFNSWRRYCLEHVPMKVPSQSVSAAGPRSMPLNADKQLLILLETATSSINN